MMSTRALLRVVCTVCVAVAISLAVSSCGGEGEEQPLAMDQPGPYLAGHHHFTVTDTNRDNRVLEVEVWYPVRRTAALTRQAEAGESVAMLEPDATRQSQYTQWLEAAPDPGATRLHHAIKDATPATPKTSWPLLMFSHCMNCVRFSTFTLVERLVSHGFVVVAPDHTGGTMYENGPMNTAFLLTRQQDISFVLDNVLADDGALLPAGLAGKLDSQRIGMYGHSFGAATCGKVLVEDDRVKAGAAVAAPMENPAMSGVNMENITEPLLLFMAGEDHMITYIGNDFILDNYAEAAPPVYRAELIDAGHMSFTDICGLSDKMLDGCCEATRNLEPDQSFTYMDLGLAHDMTRAYLTAFFRAYLNGDPVALTYLADNHWPQNLVYEYRR